MGGLRPSKNPYQFRTTAVEAGQTHLEAQA